MRKRLAAGEIRFRVSKDDLQRLERLQDFYEQNASELLRNLIRREHDRLIMGEPGYAKKGELIHGSTKTIK
jgi:hypothetical protein